MNINPADLDQAAEALHRARGQIRKIVGDQLNVRFTPTIAFERDTVPESSAHMEELLNRARARDAELARLRQEAEVETAALRQELADQRETLGEMKARWANEKNQIDSVQSAKEELEKLRNESEIAEREGDYAKVSELRYGRIPELEAEVAKAESEASNKTMLEEEVTPDIIADVVSSWTGIPAGKMM